MNNLPYQSQDYPTLTHLVEIAASDYCKLRHLMLERNEIDKFILWQQAKFIRIKGQHYDHLKLQGWND